MKKVAIVLAVVVVYAVVAWSQGLWPFSSMSEWATYEDAALGFSLRLPPSWAGYKVEKTAGSGLDSVEFLLPTAEAAWGNSHSLIIINRCTVAEFNRQRSVNMPDSCTGTELGRNTTHVFVVNSSQVQPPSDLTEASGDVGAVIESFKLK